MMVEAAAWVPGPPLLIPEVGGDSHDLGRLRDAAIAAVASLARHTAARDGGVAVIAATEQAGEFTGHRSWHGFGVGAPAAERTAVLPWPLAVGDWLLDQAGHAGRRTFHGVSLQTLDVTCDAAALLVLGEGSACHGSDAPGGFDPRSADWDATVTRLLGEGDAAGLAGLDRRLGAELRSTAAVTYPVAARLAPDRPQNGVDVTAGVLCGVGYVVSTWI